MHSGELAHQRTPTLDESLLVDPDESERPVVDFLRATPGRMALVAVVLIAVLLAVGATAKYVLPARSAAARGAPFATLVVGAVGAVIGFFVIPIVGLVVGFVVGIYLAELARLRAAGRAWDSTRAALVAIGIGMLIELTAGLLMFAVWLTGVWVT